MINVNTFYDQICLPLTVANKEKNTFAWSNIQRRNLPIGVSKLHQRYRYHILVVCHNENNKKLNK